MVGVGLVLGLLLGGFGSYLYLERGQQLVVTSFPSVENNLGLGSGDPSVSLSTNSGQSSLAKKINEAGVVTVPVGFSAAAAQTNTAIPSANAFAKSRSSEVGTDVSKRKLWLGTNDFESTLRSCLSNECYNAQVTYKDGTKRDRIGFLAPDISGMDSLVHMLSRAAKKDLAVDFNVVVDSHVPPYGYGKNHGWSRIVRFVHRLTPQALSLLMREDASAGGSKSPTKKSIEDISPSLYALQVRQLVRWHCRLSHVAAHTRMLTVFVDDLISRPVVEIYKILSFLGHRGARSDILEAVAALHKETIAGLQVGPWELSVDGAAVLHEQSYIDGARLVEAGAAALAEEMEATDGLQKWPCNSFASLDSSSPESAMLPLKSASLAANCSGMYVVCSVPVDKRGG